MYIVLSIAYRRINDFISAIRALSRAIQKYPQYIEAHIARGQIYIYQKKWDKALNDFSAVLKIQPKNGMALLGKADSLKGQEKFDQAIKTYSRVVDGDK